MPYSDNTLAEMQNEFVLLQSSYGDIVIKLLSLAENFKADKAKEYARTGVCRRLKILLQCIVNIFEIFPPDRKELLSKEETCNIDINLHAFLINISGVFDNLAWVYVYENELYGNRKDGKLSRIDIGLFNSKTQKYLPSNLKTHLTSNEKTKWYEDYCKNYRDSLAHRIPVYVPPSILNEEEALKYQEINLELNKLNISNPAELEKYDKLLDNQKLLGSIADVFAHSMTEGGRAIHIHPQLLIDFKTVGETVELFCDEFFKDNL